MFRSLLKKDTVKGIGPGGWRCPCCGPAPKDRRAFKRAAKRSQRQRLEKLIVLE